MFTLTDLSVYVIDMHLKADQLLCQKIMNMLATSNGDFLLMAWRLAHVLPAIQLDYSVRSFGVEKEQRTND